MIAVAILTPFVAAIGVLFLRDTAAKHTGTRIAPYLALTSTLVSLFSALLMASRFAANYGESQLREVWWTAAGTGINLVFAVDGVSFPLFLTTAFLFLIAALFSLNMRRFQELPPLFWALFLFLESVVLAIYAAWNFITFFAFWELFLIPVVVLMWRFGLDERRKAALQFFLYTFISSAFMVAAFAALVYYMPRIGADFDFRSGFFSEVQTLPPEKQRLVFLFLMTAFLVKMPVFPFHAWLPLTHSQAPPGTLLLSGLFLKLGSYGILRFIVPNFSGVIVEWGNVFMVLGLISMFYGAWAAYRQKSFRYIIAYSSLAHMGLLLSAIMTRNEQAVAGAIIQNVGHSFANAMLFVIVCMHLVRGKSDATNDIAPPRSVFYWAAFSLALFSAIGVPGTIGFTAEFLMLFGLSFKSWPLTIAAVSTLVMSAAYMLRLFHKVRGHEADASWRPVFLERLCLSLLGLTILWFGLYPSALADCARTTARLFTAMQGMR